MDNVDSSQMIDRRSKGGMKLNVFGIIFALIAFYSLSYISLLSSGSQTTLTSVPSDRSSLIIYNCSLVVICILMAAVVAIKARFSASFSMALLVLFGISLVLGFVLDIPTVIGVADPLSVLHIVVSAGRNPVTLGVLSCIIFFGMWNFFKAPRVRS